MHLERGAQEAEKVSVRLEYLTQNCGELSYVTMHGDVPSLNVEIAIQTA